MRVEAQIKVWRDELIDLTRRNKLISLGTGRGLLSIQSPSGAEILAGLEKGWEFHYPPPTVDEAKDDSLILTIESESAEDSLDDSLVIVGMTASRLSSTLRNLGRRAASELNDRGIRVLYLAFGELQWNDGAEDMRSPLLLVPVQLTRQNPREPYVLHSTDDDWVVNPALEVKLDQDYGVALPQWSDDDNPFDFLQQVRNAVEGERGWQVAQSAHIGTFSFSKEAMYRDLKDNEALIAEHPIARALCGEPDGSQGFGTVSEPDLEKRTAPAQTVTILDADSTQRQCILAATNGQSFVIEGPPGTGKSQTIANVIAELMRRGDSVLFVSEKAAALDVVKKRLDSVGLGTFVLELHSSKANRKRVAEEMSRALSQQPVASRSFSDLDMSTLEQRRAKLSGYALSMNTVREPLGRSLHQVLGRVAALDGVPRAPIPAAIDDSLSPDRLARLIDAAGDLGRAWGPVTRADAFVWRDLLNPQPASTRVGSLRQTSTDLLARLDALRSESDAVARELLLQPAESEGDLERVSAICSHLANQPDSVPTSWLDANNLDRATTIASDAVGTDGVARAFETTLSALVPNWAGLDDGLEESFEAQLEALGAVFDLPTSTTAKDLRVLGDELEKTRERSESLGRTIAAICARLSIPGEWLTRSQILQVIAFADLSGQSFRPEAGWLDEATLREIRLASKTLTPVLDSCRSAATKITGVFTEQVSSFDVEKLYSGPTDLVPQLGRLSSSGRSNRRQLKACAIDGNVTDAVIGALPAVRTLKRSLAKLQELGDQFSVCLGTYWNYQNTDTSSIDAAVWVAECLLDSSPSMQDQAVLAREFSCASASAPNLAEAAKQARIDLSALLTKLSTDAHRSFLLEMDPRTVAIVCDDGQRRATDLAEMLERLEDCGATSVDVNRAATALSLIAQCKRTETQFAGQTMGAADLFGERWQGRATDWPSLQETLKWASTLCGLIGDPIGPRHAQVLVNSGVGSDSLQTQFAGYQDVKAILLAEFEHHHRLRLEYDYTTSIDFATEHITKLCASMSDVEEWREFSDAMDRLKADGLGDILEFLLQIPQGELLAAVVERGTLGAWADQIVGDDRGLQPVLSAQRDQLVHEFRKLDKESVALSASRVIDACNERRPSATFGEAKVFTAEANKKRGHRPIRQLLERAGGAAQDLKPCFMMSPLSVSQYLPTSLKFDVVIFDEASQVRPCDAINAVYRGDRLIVAGDDKQLPPTTFFSSGGSDDSDEWSEDTPDVFESVLGLARGAGELASLPLRWHYRSRHESLISYSNREFYESRLITFPGAIESDPNIGIEFIHVPDGVYGRGHAKDNPVEARAVVQRIFQHVTNRPTYSLGVVAFSEAQATRIQMELEAARRQRPDLDGFFVEDRLDGFFIKNLENVQGDERDVIIFSVGYGRDEHGKMTMNFGPLNRDGGFRRLNVAVTRARYRVELLSSIVAADIVDSENYGVKCLKTYMDYAARGIIALSPAPDARDDSASPESPFEEEVLETIRRWGYDVQPQVGHLGYRIDMAIADPKRPGSWALGIECDGAAYHSSLVARDRDRLRQEVLEGLGWRLHRIWGLAWYRDRAGEEQRLRAVIHAALHGPLQRVDAAAERAIPVFEIEFEEVDFDAPAAWTIEYRPFNPIQTYFSDLSSTTARGDLATAIRAIVDAEGPVTEELLIARLGDCWPGQKFTSSRVVTVKRVLSSLVHREKLTVIEPGVFDRLGVPFSMVRRAGDFRRDKITHVPPVELALAIRNVCVDARSIDEDELTARVAGIFGWQRRGRDIAAALERTIIGMLDEGELTKGPDGRLSVCGP